MASLGADCSRRRRRSRLEATFMSALSCSDPPIFISNDLPPPLPLNITIKLMTMRTAPRVQVIWLYWQRCSEEGMFWCCAAAITSFWADALLHLLACSREEREAFVVQFVSWLHFTTIEPPVSITVYSEGEYKAQKKAKMIMPSQMNVALWCYKWDWWFPSSIRYTL